MITISLMKNILFSLANVQVKHIILGDKVTVTLVKADVEKKQIDFVLGEVDNLMAIQEQLRNGSDYAY